MLKGMRLRFSVFGGIIASAQLLPNIFWALFPPAMNRLEGNASSVAFIEYGEHILGVAIVVLLLFLTNKNVPNRIHRNGPAVFSYAFIVLYWLCWALYFSGAQTNAVIYAMVILPPVAFFCGGLAEKVYLISAFSAVFLGFHLLVALENFPL